MAANSKSRCWWFVQLVDNLPADWEDELQQLMLPGCYIVHDRDTRHQEDGTEVPKSPHVHCMFEFGSPVVAKSALAAIPESFGVGFVKPVPNKVGAYRYLLHYDQPDKAQYDREQIVHMAGFKVNISDVYNVEFKDIFDLIEEMDLINFASLMAVLVEFKPEYVAYVSSHVNLVKSYLVSRKQAIR